MAKLFQNPDGANAQARAVLAYLSAHAGIEVTWDADSKRYLAEPDVDRWHNCREQGYVVSLRKVSRQINIAFFEHRNSDTICALEWEQYTNHGNTVTIETADFQGKIYDTSHDVEYGRPAEMADWIYERLSAFWQTNSL